MVYMDEPTHTNDDISCELPTAIWDFFHSPFFFFGVSVTVTWDCLVYFGECYSSSVEE